MPNPQPGGSGFLCQGVLPLATISRYLKGAGYPPFAVVAQLQYNCRRGEGWVVKAGEKVGGFTNLSQSIVSLK